MHTRKLVFFCIHIYLSIISISYTLTSKAVCAHISVSPTRSLYFFFQCKRSPLPTRAENSVGFANHRYRKPSRNLARDRTAVCVFPRCLASEEDGSCSRGAGVSKHLPTDDFPLSRWYSRWRWSRWWLRTIEVGRQQLLLRRLRTRFRTVRDHLHLPRSPCPLSARFLLNRCATIEP